MSALPNGWAETEIGEIARIETGNTPPKGDPRLYAPEVCFYKPGDLDVGGVVSTSHDMVSQAGAAAGRLLPADSLLVTCIGNLGKSALIAAPAICNQQINAVLPSSVAEPRYLYHWSRTIKPWLEENSSATTVAIINKGRFSKAPIRIAPLPEQRRIVAKIDGLTGKSRRARDHLDHIPRLVEKYKQAVLAAAFRGELTREWRVEHGVAADYRTTFLADVLTDIRYGTAKKCDYDGGATPVLRIPNVQKGEIALDDLKSADFEDAELRKLRLQPGDLLVIRSNGSLGLVGRCAIVSEAAAGMLFAGYLIRLRFDADTVLPRYVHLWLQSGSMRSIIEGLAKSTSGVNNINSTQIEQLPVKLTNLAEQAEIVRRIDAAFVWIDRLASEATSARRLIDRLDQAVLAKAFRGELVPQDPDDEPASALLERIKAERGTRPKARRGRKAKSA